MVNNRINEKLRKISESKSESKQTHTQAEMMAQMTEQKDDTPDFESIAEELRKRQEEEKHSLNDKHVKMTIYVREDIAKAMESLYLKRGDQKRIVNEAMAQYVEREYKKLKRN